VAEGRACPLLLLPGGERRGGLKRIRRSARTRTLRGSIPDLSPAHEHPGCTYVHTSPPEYNVPLVLSLLAIMCFRSSGTLKLYPAHHSLTCVEYHLEEAPRKRLEHPTQESDGRSRCYLREAAEDAGLGEQGVL
jgi:hypothetical protein